MILLLIGIYSLIPAYGLLGFFTERLGLHHQWEVWLVGILHGFLLGAIQSFCRVFFSEMIPRGQETEFFSLYEITDKGSSWLGPLVSGVISDATHEMRYTFIFLLFMMVVPALIVLTVDPVQGKKQAMEFSANQMQARRLKMKGKV